MSGNDALRDLGQYCGILPRFYDLQGHVHPTSDETYRALLNAEGYRVETEDDCRACLHDLRTKAAGRWFPEEVIIRAQTPWNLEFGLGATWRLTDTLSGEVTAHGEPADFIALPPLVDGVYLLRASVGDRVEDVRILAAPDRLPSLQEVTGAARIWGMTLALYGLTSDVGTGLGSYGDLATVASVVGQKGGDFLGVNPVHNMGAAVEDAISPYSPSHRGFFNTEYIALDRVPGLETSPMAADYIRQIPVIFGAETSAGEIQHFAHKKRHANGLRTLFDAFVKEASDAEKQSFQAFCAEGGAHLDRFAEFESRALKFGADWRDWPEGAIGVVPEDVEFHKWLQWVANTQLADAQRSAKASGMGLGLYLDLAVGPRRDGAEAWCEADAIAPGVSTGAPPDHLSPAGQNWNLAAFSPRRLQAQNYGPLRRILAQTMRHAGVVRIDHVLGLNRSFWIPDNGAAGGYITQPFRSLLAVIKIEAARARTLVIGEDLGLVPDGFRDEMRDNGFYGYSVLQYEKQGDMFRHPDHGPAQVLSCFATHDTPTLRGYEAGRDIDWWQTLGWTDEVQAAETRTQRLRDLKALKHLGGSENDGDLAVSVTETLARSHAAMVSMQLDDVLNHVEAQNLPGTVHEHPNWRRKYDVVVEALTDAPNLTELADIMVQAGRGRGAKPSATDG